MLKHPQPSREKGASSLGMRYALPLLAGLTASNLSPGALAEEVCYTLIDLQDNRAVLVSDSPPIDLSRHSSEAFRARYHMLISRYSECPEIYDVARLSTAANEFGIRRKPVEDDEPESFFFSNYSAVNPIPSGNRSLITTASPDMSPESTQRRRVSAGQPLGLSSAEAPSSQRRRR